MPSLPALEGDLFRLVSWAARRVSYSSCISLRRDTRGRRDTSRSPARKSVETLPTPGGDGTTRVMRPVGYV